MDRPRRRRIALAALLLAISSIAAPSFAQAPARVRLVLPGCDGAFDKAELARLLRIELGGDGVRELVVGEADDALATIRVDAAPCADDAREIIVAIDDAATSKSVRRVIAVADVGPASRPRALALAIAELLRASWAELSMPDAPSPPVPVPPEVTRAVRLRVPPEEKPTPPAAPTGVGPLVQASLAARVFPAYQGVVLGPHVGASIALGATPLRARVDAVLAFGKAYDALGTIDLTLATGALGLALAGGPSGVHLEVGPALVLGGGFASGQPSAGNTGASASALIAIAEIAGNASVRVSPGWWTFFGLEAGGTLRSLEAQAQGHPASGFGGPLLGVALGVGREL